MTQDRHAPEVIVIKEGLRASLLRDAGTFATFASLIGVGVILNSPAMQWVGAIIGFIVIAVKGKSVVRPVSIAEARKRLDEIEREGGQ